MDDHNDLVHDLRKRAEIRRSIPRSEPDRIADLLERAASEIERLRQVKENAAKIADDYAAPNRFKVSDQWKEHTPALVYETAAIDVGMWIAQEIRKLPNPLSKHNAYNPEQEVYPGGYSKVFVKSILDADAAEPEGTITCIEDLDKP